LGQEEIPDALTALSKDDFLFSTHRNHGHYLAKGGSEESLWDEIRGLQTGINKGLSGSQCFSDPAINFHASSIVGGSIGMAVGTALGLKGTRRIAVSCFGDAAVEEGVFWEALNFSVLKSLPIFFICENNGMSVEVPIEERQVSSISERVKPWGICFPYSILEGISICRTDTPCFCEIKVKREGEHCYFPKL
jgi:pyruvate dehydrogenase E1 component alpha subunit